MKQEGRYCQEGIRKETRRRSSEDVPRVYHSCGISL
jgi:hypothetical protein